MPHFRLGLAFVGAATLGLTLAHPGQVLWMDENMPWGDEWQEPEEEWNDAPAEEEPWPEEEWNDEPANEEPWPEEVWEEPIPEEDVWQEDTEESWGDQPAEEEQWPEEPWEERSDWVEEPMEEPWQEQTDDAQEEPVTEEVWHDAAGSEPCEDCSMGGWSSSSEGSEPAECEGVPDGEPCSGGMCIGGYCIAIAFTSSSESSVAIEESSASSVANACAGMPDGEPCDNGVCLGEVCEQHVLTEFEPPDTEIQTLELFSSSSRASSTGVSCDACAGLSVAQCAIESKCSVRTKDLSQCEQRSDACADSPICNHCWSAGTDEAECAKRGCILDFDTATCVPDPEVARCHDPVECRQCAGQTNEDACNAKGGSCEWRKNEQQSCERNLEQCQLSCFLCSYQRRAACEEASALTCRAAHEDCRVSGLQCDTFFRWECETLEQKFLSDNADKVTMTRIMGDDAVPGEATEEWNRLFGKCTSMTYIKDRHSDSFQCEAFLRQTKACVQALPSCSRFNIQDLGCNTFASYGLAELWAEELRTTLPPGVVVTVSGEQAVSSWKCTTKTSITVDCDAVKTELPQCGQGGSCHMRDRIAVDCQNADGQKQQEICCLPLASNAGASLGVWTAGDRCPERCEEQGYAMTCGGAATIAAEKMDAGCLERFKEHCALSGKEVHAVCEDSKVNTGYLWGCTMQRRCDIRCLSDAKPADGGDPGGGWED